MGQIYANAEKVLVWLGEGDETISRLFQHFDQYHIGEILSVISMSGRSIDGCLGKAEISGFPSAQAIDELIRYPATLAHTAWHRSLTLRPSSNTPATLIRRRELFQDESAQIISIKLHKHLLDHYQAERLQDTVKDIFSRRSSLSCYHDILNQVLQGKCQSDTDQLSQMMHELEPALDDMFGGKACEKQVADLLAYGKEDGRPRARLRVYSHGKEITPQMSQAISKFCELSYWSRTWIIQELLLAKSVLFIHQESVVSWDDLWSGVLRECGIDLAMVKAIPPDTRVITGSRDPPKLPKREVVAFSLLVSPAFRHVFSRKELSLTKKHVGSHGSNLRDLLASHKDTACADRRDRIFSLLSLVPEGASFPVDYRDDAATLAFRACSFFSTDAGFFDAIINALHLSQEEIYDCLYQIGSATSKVYINLKPFTSRFVCQGCGVTVQGVSPAVAILCDIILCLDAFSSRQHVFGVSGEQVDWLGPIQVKRRGDNSLKPGLAHWIEDFLARRRKFSMEIPAPNDLLPLSEWASKNHRLIPWYEGHWLSADEA